MGKNTKNELSMKSRLLFNNLDMCHRVILDLNQKEDKRIKCLKTIMQTYSMTIRPFIIDEPGSYQQKVNDAIKNREEYIRDMITAKVTVETLNIKILPILEHLKNMISTCKTNLETVNSLFNIN